MSYNLKSSLGAINGVNSDLGPQKRLQNNIKSIPNQIFHGRSTQNNTIRAKLASLFNEKANKEHIYTIKNEIKIREPTPTFGLRTCPWESGVVFDRRPLGGRLFERDRGRVPGDGSSYGRWGRSPFRDWMRRSLLGLCTRSV